MGRPLPTSRRVKRADVHFCRSQSPGLVQVDSLGAQSVWPANATNGTNGSNYAFFSRVRFPFAMRVHAIGLPLNVVLAGTSPVIRFNVGLFTVNEDSEYGEPVDQFEPGAYCQISITSGLSGSGRQIMVANLTAPTRVIEANTPMFVGGLWSVISGTVAGSSQGGVHTFNAFDPAFAQGANSGYRAGVRSTAVRAYSAASMEGLPAAIDNGTAFPTNWTAVNNSGQTNASDFGNIDWILFGDEIE